MTGQKPNLLYAYHMPQTTLSSVVVIASLPISIHIFIFCIVMSGKDNEEQLRIGER